MTKEYDFPRERNWNLVNFKEVNRWHCVNCKSEEKDSYEVIFYSQKTKKKLVRTYCENCLLQMLKKLKKAKYAAKLVEERIVEKKI